MINALFHPVNWRKQECPEWHVVKPQSLCPNPLETTSNKAEPPSVLGVCSDFRPPPTPTSPDPAPDLDHPPTTPTRRCPLPSASGHRAVLSTGRTPLPQAPTRSRDHRLPLPAPDHPRQHLL